MPKEDDWSWIETITQKIPCPFFFVFRNMVSNIYRIPILYE